jgi:hypothetical protein
MDVSERREGNFLDSGSNESGGASERVRKDGTEAIDRSRIELMFEQKDVGSDYVSKA